MSEQNNRESCYICGRGNADILESHHIVPRRFGGSDESTNLVDLCPSCHRALERLYDKRFYDELDVKTVSGNDEREVCGHSGCKSRDTQTLNNSRRLVETVTCDGHRVCDKSRCTNKNVSPIPHEDGGVVLVCDDHRICSQADCNSTNVEIVTNKYDRSEVVCISHWGDVAEEAQDA